MQYAKDLFHAILLELSPLDLTIDHIHRIPKPSILPDSVPRDVLMRVHFFSPKDHILKKKCSLGKPPESYVNIQIYVDLSKFTLDLRRQLNTITKTLCNNNIVYKWSHPTNLSVDHNGATFTITSLNKSFPCSWNGASFQTNLHILELTTLLTRFLPLGSKLNMGPALEIVESIATCGNYNHCYANSPSAALLPPR